MKQALAFVLILNLLSSVKAQAPSDSLAQAEQRRIETEQLRREVARSLRELADMDLLDKSMQVRHQGRDKLIRKQYNYRPRLEIGITLFSKLNIDELWPRVLTGKWVYTADGKKDTGYLGGKMAVNLNLNFDTLSSRSAFKIEASIKLNKALQEHLGEGLSETALSDLNQMIRAEFDNQVYTRPKEAPVANVIFKLQAYLDALGLAYWPDFVDRTKQTRLSRYVQDIKALSEDLNKAITSNQLLASSNALSSSKNHYLISRSTLVNDALSLLKGLPAFCYEINQYASHQQYFLLFESDYALDSTELKEVSNSILSNAANAQNSPVCLYIINKINDTEKGLLWYQLDFAFSGAYSSFISSVEQHITPGIYKSDQLEEYLFLQIQHLICHLQEKFTRQYPEGNFEQTVAICQEATSIIAGGNSNPNSEKIHFQPDQAGLCYVTRSGVAFKPRSKLGGTRIEMLNGNIYDFTADNTYYEGIIIHPVGNEMEAYGFSHFLAQNKWQEIEQAAKDRYQQQINQSTSTVEAIQHANGKAKKLAQMEWELLESSFSASKYSDYEACMAGDWVVRTRVVAEDGCKKELIRWQTKTDLPLTANQHKQRPFTGDFKTLEIQAGAKVEVIADYGQVDPLHCLMLETKAKGKYGARFIEAHYRERLSIEEKDAVLKIATLYDELGAQIVHDYYQEQEAQSILELFLTDQEVNRTINLIEGATRYRNYYYELSARADLFLRRKAEIKQLSDQDQAAEFTALLTDGELKSLSLAQKKHLFLKLSSGAMMSWKDNEEGEAIRILKSLPAKSNEELQFLQFLENAIYTDGGKSIGLLEHLDKTFGGVWNSNYKSFIEVITKCCLNQISQSDYNDLITSPEKNTIVWGAKSWELKRIYNTQWDGKKIKVESKSPRIDEEGYLVTDDNYSGAPLGYGGVASIVYDKQTISPKRPLLEFVGLINLSSDQYARGLPMVIPTFAVKYLNSQEHAEFMENVIMTSANVLSFVSGVGAIANGARGIKLAFAIMELVSVTTEVTASLLKEAGVVDAELAKQIQYFTLFVDLYSFSIVELPELSAKIAARGNKIVSRIQALKELGDINETSLLYEFSKNLRLKMLDMGIQVTDAVGTSLASAKTRMIDFAANLAPNVRIFEMPEFVTYYTTYARVAIENGATRFSEFIKTCGRRVEDATETQEVLAKKYWSNSVGATKRGIDGITDEAKLVIDDFPSREIDNKFWDELYDSELWESTIKNSGKQEDYIKAFVALEEAGENGLDATKLQKVTDNIDEVERVGGLIAWRRLIQNSQIVKVLPPDVRTLDEIYNFLKTLNFTHYKIDDVENLIRHSTKGEIGFVFSKEGEYLFGPIKGSRNDIGYTISMDEIDELLKSKDITSMQDIIITHNHPPTLPDVAYSDPKWITETFSSGDVAASLESGIKELRVVTQEGRKFVLKNSSPGDLDAMDELEDLYDSWKTSLRYREDGVSTAFQGIPEDQIDEVYNLAKERIEKIGWDVASKEIHLVVDHEIWLKILPQFNADFGNILQYIVK